MERIDINDINNLIEKLDCKNKTLIIQPTIYFQLKDEIDILGIDFIVDDRLDEKTQCIIVDGDIFDSIYYL